MVHDELATTQKLTADPSWSVSNEVWHSGLPNKLAKNLEKGEPVSIAISNVHNNFLSIHLIFMLTRFITLKKILLKTLI